MARFHGKQGRGAMREVRALKRRQAIARNKATPMTRRAGFRRLQALVEEDKR